MCLKQSINTLMDSNGFYSKAEPQPKTSYLWTCGVQRATMGQSAGSDGEKIYPGAIVKGFEFDPEVNRKPV